MRSLRPQIQAPLVLLLAAATVIGTIGCRSGIFKQSGQTWKKPDMSGLVFWKKGDETIPPPPAHHFTPANSSGQIASLQNATESKVAESKKGGIDSGQPAKTAASNSGQRLTQRVSEKNKAISEKIASEIAAKSSNIASNVPNNKPIRTPYEVPVDASLAKAQADFNAALAGTKKAIDDSLATSTAKATEITGEGANDFQPPAANSVAPREKFQLPDVGDLQQKIAAAQNSFTPEKAEINYGLYDGAGKLKTAAQNTLAGAQQGAANFEQSLTARLKNQTHELAAQTVGVTAEVTKGLKPAGEQQLTEVQSQIEQAKQEIATLKQQLADTQKAATTAAIKTLAPIAASGMGNVASQTKPAVSPVVATSQAVATKFNQTTNQALQLVSQPSNFSPLDRVTSSGSVNPPSNHLRGGITKVSGTTEVGANPLAPIQASVAAPAAGVTPIAGGYPSTPHSNYAPIASASGSTDNGPGGIGTRVADRSHVSDVEIPDSVLRGSGSYAPGSVNLLRR